MKIITKNLNTMNFKTKNNNRLKPKFSSSNLVVFLLALIISNVAFSQDNDSEQGRNNDLRPYRIGIKIGTPMIVGLDLEYVTPLWNKRIAPFLDFTTIGLEINEDANLNYTAFELGTNIYFNSRGDGRGFYGALSYQNMNAKLEQTDYEAEDGRQFTGTATSKITYGGLNTKIGVKVGRTFYFRTELGYSFGSIPTNILTTGTYNGEQVTDNQDIKEDIEDSGVISAGGMPLFNIGFGFAF